MRRNAIATNLNHVKNNKKDREKREKMTSNQTLDMQKIISICWCYRSKFVFYANFFVRHEFMHNLTKIIEMSCAMAFCCRSHHHDSQWHKQKCHRTKIAKTQTTNTMRKRRKKKIHKNANKKAERQLSMLQGKCFCLFFGAKIFGWQSDEKSRDKTNRTEDISHFCQFSLSLFAQFLRPHNHFQLYSKSVDGTFLLYFLCWPALRTSLSVMLQ